VTCFYYMDINVKVTIDAAPEFLAVLQGLLKPAGLHAVPAGNSTNGAGKSKKADKPAEKTTETTPVVDATDDAGDGGENSAAAPTVTIEQIRALIPEKKAKVGTDKLKALLNEYGVANVSTLPAAKYDDFYEKLKNLAA
jgi:hypothetical protein